MLKTLQQRNTSVKIVLGVVLGLICIAMVITLVPGPVGTIGNAPDTLARVGGEDITQNDVQTVMQRISRSQQIPEMMRGMYARQVLDQLVFEKALEYEGDRLGIHVTNDEVGERIRQVLPQAFPGGQWIGSTSYVELIQQQGLTVPEFERFIREGLLQEKFQQLVTSGIQVSPEEIKQEYIRRNEKVAIEYAQIKPADLASTINPSESELEAYFKENQVKYQVPEKRSGQYALLDTNALRQKTKIPESDLNAYYQLHINDYKVPDRVHLEQILFSTIGKTDAELAEIRTKAADIDKQVKAGANFEDLAKKNSDDTNTKDKGGDLGWIVRGQTVPEFESVAFSLPKDSVSGVVSTQYGLVIMKILDKETARTKSFDEVKQSIEASMLEDKVSQEGQDISSKIATAVRQGSRQPIQDLARKFDLQLGPIPLTAFADTLIPGLGTSQELRQTLFLLQPGEISQPMQIDRGYVVLSADKVLPAHPATLAEVHDKVVSEYRAEKSVMLARTKAEDLAKQAKAAGDLAKAAKALGLGTKKSDAFSREGNVGDLGPAKAFAPAFTMPVGQVGPALPLGGNWVVYRVASHEDANMAELLLQSDSIKQQLQQTKQSAAFEAFHDALEDQLRREGKLVISESAVKNFAGGGKLPTS